MSILYEGKNIEGSPFNVRVHDPGQIRVLGLDAGLASRNYTFSGESTVCLRLEPLAVAVSPFGWFMTHCGWLAG